MVVSKTLGSEIDTLKPSWEITCRNFPLDDVSGTDLARTD